MKKHTSPVIIKNDKFLSSMSMEKDNLINNKQNK